MHTGPRRRHRRHPPAGTRGRVRLRPRKSAKPELIPILAFLGTLLAAMGLPIKAAGLYRVSQAIERMQLGEPDDQVQRLLFSAAGQPLEVANFLLIAGGTMMVFAYRWGGFHERWFLWSMLILGIFYIWQPFFGTVFGIIWLHSAWKIWRNRKPAAVREVTVIPE